MANIDFYCDIDRRVRVNSFTDRGIVTGMHFSQGDTLTFRVRALQPTGQVVGAPFSYVTNIGKTLELAIGTKVGNSSTHYVEQFTWDLNGDETDPYFYADVSFNTTNVSNLIGSGSSATAWLEIKLIDSLPKTIFIDQVTLDATVIKSDAATVVPGQTALSAEAARALYLTHSIPCSSDDPVWFVNKNTGKQGALYVDDDGSTHFDPA